MIQNMLREEALGSFRDGVTMESRKIVWACILLLAVLVFGGVRLRLHSEESLHLSKKAAPIAAEPLSR